MRPLSASMQWLRKAACNDECGSNNLRLFRGLSEGPEGPSTGIGSQLSRHPETLPCLCSEQSRPSNHTACPSGLDRTASARLPEHDGGQARKPREYAKSTARCPAYLLPVSCP